MGQRFPLCGAGQKPNTVVVEGRGGEGRGEMTAIGIDRHSYHFGGTFLYSLPATQSHTAFRTRTLICLALYFASIVQACLEQE